MLYGEINRQRMKIINEHVVADTIDYLEARFAFSADWDGLEKWVHFAKDGEVYDIRLTDNCVRKEDHLNLSAGIWKVYLHGNKFSGGKVIERITTNAAILKVEPTGTLDGEPFPTVPPSAGEQIIAAAVAAEAGAKESARRAEASQASSAQSAGDATLSAKAAEESRNAAELAETNAAGHEKSAAKSAEEAGLSADRAEQVATANGYIEFELDNEDGILYLYRTDNIVDEIDFELDEETGELEVIIE